MAVAIEVTYLNISRDEEVVVVDCCGLSGPDVTPLSAHPTGSLTQMAADAVVLMQSVPTTHKRKSHRH